MSRGPREAGSAEQRADVSLEQDFGAFAIAGGIPTFEISRMMGTSVLQIERTYGHLLRDAAARATAALDLFDAKSETTAVFGQLSGDGRGDETSQTA